MSVCVCVCVCVCVRALFSLNVTSKGTKTRSLMTIIGFGFWDVLPFNLGLPNSVQILDNIPVLSALVSTGNFTLQLLF